jgi:PAS domain S-box-containing protein
LSTTEVLISPESADAPLEAEHLRQLVEELPQLIRAARPDGSCRYANRSWYQYTGTRPGEAHGTGWHAAIHPDDLAGLQRQWERGLASGEPFEVEYRCRRQDGTWRWFHERTWAQRDAAGNILLWFSTCTDVDESKRRIEEQRMLVEEAERARVALDVFFDAIPAGLGLYDQALRYIRVNPTLAAINGVPAEAHAGRSMSEVIPWIAPHIQPLVDRVATTGELVSVEVPAKLPGSDEERHWLARYAPVRSRDGRFLGVVAIVMEVTELKRAQEALRASEARLRRLFSAGPVGAIIWDVDGRILEANDRFLEMLGYTREELTTGRLDWRKLTPPGFEEVDATAIADLQAQGYTRMLEKQYLRKDGSRVDILLGGSLFLDGTQQGISLVVDISERKRVEAERERLITALERSNRELDQFAYVASHDLKAPLRGIANLSQWIEDDLKEAMTPEVAEQMRLLRGRVHRMEALINGILDYSRAGRVRGRAEPVDTGRLVTECIELLAPPAGAAIEVAPGMPAVLSERVPLQQAFLNLLSNALKHARRSDVRVQVGVRAAGDFWEFSVSDNGPGIPPEYHERIWGLFQTLQARDQVEGTGIGLSVVKKSVEARGGRAWVESVPGQGATFRFTWPKRPTGS